MNVGESRSRVAMSRFGVAPPVLQWEVVGPGGVVLGTAGFGWPEHGVVGEFDGLVRYGRVLRAGQVRAEAVVAEKRREDRMRAVSRASSAGCGRSSTRSPTSRSGSAMSELASESSARRPRSAGPSASEGMR